MTNSKNIFVKTLKIFAETVFIFNMIGAIIIIIMGCFVIASFHVYDPNDIGYDDVEDDISYLEYGVTFIFHNLEYAEQDEYLYFFDQDNKFFEIVDVYRTEEITTYTKTYSVQSKTLGEDIKAEVDLKENEEAIIYVDYLERTITVKTKTVEE